MRACSSGTRSTKPVCMSFFIRVVCTLLAAIRTFGTDTSPSLAIVSLLSTFERSDVVPLWTGSLAYYQALITTTQAVRPPGLKQAQSCQCDKCPKCARPSADAASEAPPVQRSKTLAAIPGRGNTHVW
eukprot:TRINITY_DN11039_c0_g1_i1.p1 TRINITY_DN11039_c0_g1~~TRINITY_DN11039_c0_g1_i1.p1  ORF type:complete len:128 (+),score=18.58 TRINITY_DN11039_c0_g1_i1:382-765(+)